MKLSSTHNWLVWSVVILVVLNITALSALWYSRYSGHHPPRPLRTATPLEDLIVREVGLNQEQESVFRGLHARHRQVKDSLEAESYRLKEQIQNELFAASPDTIKMLVLADRVGNLQAEFEKQVFRHFKELKALCRPDQETKLKTVLSEMLAASQYPPPPLPGEQGKPPRRPDEDRRPPPPREP